MDTGARVGKYAVGRKLGQGGFGVLYVARDTELDRELAIKFLRPEHSLRPQVVQRFLQEARAAARINHPGIVTVFECGQVSGTNTRADGTVFIAMELLAGETLAIRLARGVLPLATAVGLVRQLAGALAAAHASGIVHRDLKPQNIFLVADPAIVGGERVKILDFGIAKLADGFGASVQTHSMEMLGTPMYMSPEQCKSSAKVDARSDIYSLGCMLFEMVCGRTPFQGDSGELIAKHQLVAPPDPHEFAAAIPSSLGRLIAAMLAKSPDARPQTMEAVIEALDVAAASVDGSATTGMMIVPHDEQATTVSTPARGPGVIAVLAAHRNLVLGGTGAAVLGVVIAIAATRGSKEVAAPVEDARVVAVVAIDAAAPIDAPPVEPTLEVDANVASCDAEALVSAGTNSEAMGAHAQALKQFEMALACRPDEHIRALAFMAACNAANLDSARRYWQQMSPDVQPQRLQICVRNHITKQQLDAPIAADDNAAELKRLKSECLSHVADRKWTDLSLCADKLAAVDKIDADAFRKEARDENAADIAKGKMEQELANGSLKTARKLLDQIHDNSTYKQEAQADYDTAEQKTVDDFRKRAQKNQRAGKCKDNDVLVVQAGAVSAKAAAEVRQFICSRAAATPPTAPGQCDSEAMVMAGTNSEAMGAHAQALKQFEDALHCKSDTHTTALAFMAACNASNLAKAKLHWKHLSPNMQDARLQMCVRNHISKDMLDAP